MSISACRSCGGDDLTEVLNLDEQYLSDFRADDSRPPKYPLRLLFCETCTLVQLADTAPRTELYHDRYSFRSGTSEVIRDDLQSIVDTATAAYVEARNEYPKTWLDIASNDGTLLSNVHSGAFRVGVDPLKHLADEARQHADEIVVEFFDPTTFGSQQFDVVTSVSMFYDLDDPNDFVAGVAKVLAPDGVWVIQQNAALDMLQSTVFDNICHEHVTYWSLVALAHLLYRHGLIVTDVQRSPVNGGCMRTVVKHRARHSRIFPSIGEYLECEAEAGTAQLDAWQRFAGESRKRIDRLRDFVNVRIEDGHKVAIYGASTRGSTMWQAAGLGAESFVYAVERQAGKVGKWMSALGIPIVSEMRLRSETFSTGQPAYAVVGPWFFSSAIVRRELEHGGYLDVGGRLVFPLPTLQVVDEFGRVTAP